MIVKHVRVLETPYQFNTILRIMLSFLSEIIPYLLNYNIQTIQWSIDTVEISL